MNIGAVDATTGAVRPYRPDASSQVSAVVVRGNVVYAGGKFNNIGGLPRAGLAATDATSGNALAGWQADISAPTYVYSLASAGDALYVGGGFAGLSNQPQGFVGALFYEAPTTHVYLPAVQR